MTLRSAGSLLQTTYQRWSAHNAQRLGAALAYYALLSVSPLIVLMVAICGYIFNQTLAEKRILDETQMLLGKQAAITLHSLIGDAKHIGTGVVATAIALLTLFFGASGVFVELRYALNTICEAPARTGDGWRSLVRDRLVSFAMVLGCGVFMLASLLVTTVFAVAEKFATGFIPMPPAAGEIINLVVSLVLLTLFFALLYKTVPNVAIGWRDVGVGAFATAVLFVAGKGLLAVYLTKAAVGSTYGAAGSLVAFIVWVYYSAQIFFFGAEFTQVYSEFRVRAGHNRTAAESLK